MSEAAGAGVGVLVKKGLASGRLAPSTAVPFVLQQPAVASMIVGTLTLEHLRENVTLAESAEAACRRP